jgi:hypothetical protein
MQKCLTNYRHRIDQYSTTTNQITLVRHFQPGSGADIQCVATPISHIKKRGNTSSLTVICKVKKVSRPFGLVLAYNLFKVSIIDNIISPSQLRPMELPAIRLLIRHALNLTAVRAEPVEAQEESIHISKLNANGFLDK